MFDLREIRLTGRTGLSRHGGVLDLQVPLLKKAKDETQIDRDVHDAYRDLREQYSSLKVILLVKHLSSLIQTTGNDLENRYLLSSICMDT